MAERLTNWKDAINPVLLDRARAMRHESAPAEQILWWCLRDRRMGGHKLRRQHVIEPYVADFYCHALRLIIELDGDSHGDRQAYDHRRTKFLERDGLRVVRFLNSDVFDHLDSVLDVIFRVCERLSTAGPHPNPLPRGEGTRA
jgi:very-short-patch-repair endonuclease